MTYPSSTVDRVMRDPMRGYLAMTIVEQAGLKFVKNFDGFWHVGPPVPNIGGWLTKERAAVNWCLQHDVAFRALTDGDLT